KSDAKKQEIDLTSLVEVAGWKAAGNKLTSENLMDLGIIPETDSSSSHITNSTDTQPKPGELF
ncbi:MAG: hypothetical protein ACRDE2_07665, partial [Chitinophagaceae bacterium]